MILQSGDEIQAGDILFENEQTTVGEACSNSLNGEDEAATLGAGVKHHEYNIIIEALKRSNGSRKYAAECLGVSPRTLRYKLARMREEDYLIPGDSD